MSKFTKLIKPMDNSKIYYEKCDQSTMGTYPIFIDKLKQIEKIVKPLTAKNDPELLSNVKANYVDDYDDMTTCPQCDANKKFYRLGNIIWSNNLKHNIEHHQSYPSEYFIKIIICTSIINGAIINPPLMLKPSDILHFTYIFLHYNKLLIIDALMKEGSHPRYENNDKFIYSEHSGVISIKDHIVDNIIVSAETNRTDANDDNILLPINVPDYKKYAYLFHTHPNTKHYAGRISEGVLYEFPSANDLINFVYYHDKGKTQGSLIIAPEGIYLIRQIANKKRTVIDTDLYYLLRKFILKLEKMAINKYTEFLDKLTDPDVFNETVGQDFTFINMYNKFIEPSNLFVEYYPREKKNNEWCLKSIYLQYVEKN